MALLSKGINNLVDFKEYHNNLSIYLGDHPILQDFDSLWHQAVADNKCTRNYYNHIATWYGDVDYAYTGVRHTAQVMYPEFEELAKDLEKQLEYPVGYFNCLLVNLYTNKGIAPHSDDEAIFMENDGTVGAVATISLGGEAIGTITRNDRSEDPIRIDLQNGNFYLMPEGDFQSKYKHSVSKPLLKLPSAHQRISLTFRHIP
jgi:alkylated DNA repair dioxygenase AlkB